MELSTASNVIPGELLRTALRRLRFFSLKHGDETGESGADAILFTRTPDDPTSYRLVNSGVLLTAQADGASVITLEGLEDRSEESGGGSGRDLLSPRLSACSSSLSSAAQSNAAIARRRRFWPPSICWTRSRSPVKLQCAPLLPASFAVAQAM